MMKDQLAGKVIIVTGAGSGMGKDAAILFRKRGATVIATARDTMKLEKCREALSSQGEQVHFIAAELTREKDCECVVDFAMQVAGRFNGLANFAGAWVPGTAVEISEAAWDLAFQANVKTAWMMSRAALKVMIPAGEGAIVNIASTLGMVVVPGSAAYSAAKGALIQLTRSLALDFGKCGVRSNCLCPGLTDTPMTTNVFSRQDWIAELTKAFPLGRLGNPRDVTQAAAFLLSDDASWINGAVIPIDGGYLVSSEAP